jgi:hypothetical protein
LATLADDRQHCLVGTVPVDIVMNLPLHLHLQKKVWVGLLQLFSWLLALQWLLVSIPTMFPFHVSIGYISFPPITQLFLPRWLETASSWSNSVGFCHCCVLLLGAFFAVFLVKLS